MASNERADSYAEQHHGSQENNSKRVPPEEIMAAFAAIKDPAMKSTAT